MLSRGPAGAEQRSPSICEDRHRDSRELLPAASGHAKGPDYISPGLSLGTLLQGRIFQKNSSLSSSREHGHSYACPTLMTLYPQ
jgi:hypothetical protein